MNKKIFNKNSIYYLDKEIFKQLKEKVNGLYLLIDLILKKC